MQRIFGKVMSPEELVKKWKTNLRGQERLLDKQIRGIETEELKVKKSLKEAAKKGDKTVMRMLAKEMLNSRKAKDRLHTSKAQLSSIGMQLQQQAAQVKIAGTLKKSTDIMKMVNRLVKLPEIANTMQEMSKEMMKAGIIEEMMQDTLEMDDDEELEEEAEAEVDKILHEITSGLLLQPGAVGKTAPVEDVIIDEGEDEEVKARLEALRS